LGGGSVCVLGVNMNLEEKVAS